jgi:hypothetical protein
MGQHASTTTKPQLPTNGTLADIPLDKAAGGNVNNRNFLKVEVKSKVSSQTLRVPCSPTSSCRDILSAIEETGFKLQPNSGLILSWTLCTWRDMKQQESRAGLAPTILLDDQVIEQVLQQEWSKVTPLIMKGRALRARWIVDLVYEPKCVETKAHVAQRARVPRSYKRISTFTSHWLNPSLKPHNSKGNAKGKCRSYHRIVVDVQLNENRMKQVKVNVTGNLNAWEAVHMCMRKLQLLNQDQWVLCVDNGSNQRRVNSDESLLSILQSTSSTSPPKWTLKCV